MSEHAVTSPEISFAPEHASGTKKIWRTFWLLSALTIVELGIGLSIYTIHKGPNPNASLVLAFMMGVTFFLHYKGGLAAGEMTALYLAGYIAILLAGPGKYSFDGNGGGSAGSAAH